MIHTGASSIYFPQYSPSRTDTDLDVWIKHLTKYKIEYTIKYSTGNTYIFLAGGTTLVFIESNSFKGIE